MTPPPRLPERGRMAALYGWLNQLLAYAESLRPVQSLNTLTSHTGIGVVRQGLVEPTEASATSGIRRLKIESVGDSSLTTWEYGEDGELTGSNGPEVAIPKYLRSSTYQSGQFGDYVFTEVGGEIRMRFIGHFSPDAYIVQEVFPPYEVGDDIYAIQPIGKTDVTSDDEVLEWVDTNVEGRALRSKFVLVDVCRLENGVNVARKIPVEGGNVF